MGKKDGTDQTGPTAKTSKWAKNLTELGEALVPKRERAWLSDQKKHPACPKPRQNGSYNIPAWQKFLDEHAKGTAHDRTQETTTSRREGLDLDNEIKRIKLEQLRGDSISRDEVVSTVGAMFLELKRELEKVADHISSHLVGMGSPGAVKKRLSAELRRTLMDYSNIKVPETDDLKKKAFFKKLYVEWSDRRNSILSGDGLSST